MVSYHMTRYLRVLNEESVLYNFGRIFNRLDTMHERDRHRATATVALSNPARLQLRSNKFDSTMYFDEAILLYACK